MIFTGKVNFHESPKVKHIENAPLWAHAEYLKYSAHSAFSVTRPINSSWKYLNRILCLPLILMVLGVHFTGGVTEEVGIRSNDQEKPITAIRNDDEQMYGEDNIVETSVSNESDGTRSSFPREELISKSLTHQDPTDTSRMLLNSATYYACGLLVLQSGMVYGLEAAKFGVSRVSMEYLPLQRCARFTFPIVPVLQALFSSRIVNEKPLDAIWLVISGFFLLLAGDAIMQVEMD